MFSYNAGINNQDIIFQHVEIRSINIDGKKKKKHFLKMKSTYETNKYKFIRIKRIYPLKNGLK